MRAVAPGLTAGRGLKQLLPRPAPVAPDQRSARPYGRARIETRAGASRCGTCRVAPGLTAGRGLKRGPDARRDAGRIRRSARPYGRARIETCSRLPRPTCTSGCSARPYGRARIETSGSCRWSIPTPSAVAPGLTAGRGLKRAHRRRRRARSAGVAPGLTAGRGLKLPGWRLRRQLTGRVAPGLTAGRGLKPRWRRAR